MSRFNEPSMQQGETGQIGPKIEETKQSLREMGAQAKETAQQQIGQLRESAAEYYQQGRERAMQWEQSVEDYVREQPMKSVLIAAGVGMLFGILWRRS